MAADVRGGAILAGLLLLPALGRAALGQPSGGTQSPSAPSTGTAAPGAPPSAAKQRHATVSGPIATLPGFEMLADGASRLFVELTQTVAVDEKKNGRRITYTLKGAHVIHRNNENALVTVHFNTPVQRARLLPSGGGLVFVVDLRADSTPTWKMTPAKDNSAILEIVFPKGDFLPANQEPEPEPGADSASSNAASSSSAPPAGTSSSQGPPPRGGGRHRGGGGGGGTGAGGAGGS
jgi:hypothetical protein